MSGLTWDLETRVSKSVALIAALELLALNATKIVWLSGNTRSLHTVTDRRTDAQSDENSISASSIRSLVGDNNSLYNYDVK